MGEPQEVFRAMILNSWDYRTPSMDHAELQLNELYTQIRHALDDGAKQKEVEKRNPATKCVLKLW